MTQPEGMRLVLFIDVDEWNDAGWYGTLFLTYPNDTKPPGMALLFENENAGRKIFAGLIKRLGKKDTDDLLRVSIIEGDIPDEDPGYTVYIGVDMSNYEAWVKKTTGDDLSSEFVTLVSRFNRMHPAPDSPHLARFKASYAKHKTFLLMPACGRPPQPTPIFDLAIEKQQVNFLRVEDLKKDDLESVVLQKSKDG
jgi:hypothetical protein